MVASVRIIDIFTLHHENRINIFTCVKKRFFVWCGRNPEVYIIKANAT